MNAQYYVYYHLENGAWKHKLTVGKPKCLLTASQFQSVGLTGRELKSSLQKLQIVSWYKFQFWSNSVTEVRVAVTGSKS